MHAIAVVMEGEIYLSAEVNAGIVEDYEQRLLGKGEPTKPNWPRSGQVDFLKAALASISRSLQMVHPIGVEPITC